MAIRSGRGRNPNSAGAGGGPPGQRNGSERDFQQWPEQQGQEIRVTFTVSNVKCGLIIGRGECYPWPPLS